MYAFSNAATRELADTNIRFNEVYLNLRVQPDEIAKGTWMTTVSDFSKNYELLLNNPGVKGTRVSASSADDFKKLDAQVMQDAVYIPYVFDKSLFYRSDRLTNVRVNFAVGSYYDWVNMGVSS